MNEDKGLVNQTEGQRDATVDAVKAHPYSEHMRYLGALGLLCACSVHVPEDIREMIEAALADACEANPGLTWRRVLGRLEIETRL